MQCLYNVAVLLLFNREICSGLSLSGWVHPCTVISQGQTAKFKPLQPPAAAGQRCENLYEKNVIIVLFS